MDCLQHTSPRKYASKKDVERQKRQEKAALLQKKRRSLELKQERLTQKGAREAAEGDTYHISQVLLYQTQYFSPPNVEVFLDNLNVNCRSGYDSRCRHREYP